VREVGRAKLGGEIIERQRGEQERIKGNKEKVPAGRHPKKTQIIKIGKSGQKHTSTVRVSLLEETGDEDADGVRDRCVCAIERARLRSGPNR